MPWQADLYGAYASDSGDARTGELVDALRTVSPEFTTLWSEHPVLGPYCAPKRFRHPPAQGSLLAVGNASRLS
ncbi:MmyB family transcriptional regulator [Streptomyces brasiliensis]|uniref:MmyB-like transcription regulator ligand binding domain-containing protein n=1 Tax=Streptomyces brasiliensis TaxID=1954 RepID=A0A917K3H2_9ACTN|nr:hypothetical protein [Streptomyces brasiliensis]GGI99454.1 hypothetical protein GCM10010121_007140 [Streptomyces brasiliensis]